MASRCSTQPASGLYRRAHMSCFLQTTIQADQLFYLVIDPGLYGRIRTSHEDAGRAQEPLVKSQYNEVPAGIPRGTTGHCERAYPKGHCCRIRSQRRFVLLVTVARWLESNHA